VTIAACMLTTPVVAQAPASTTTAFDGTYIGVSRTVEGLGDPTERTTGQRSSMAGIPRIISGAARRQARRGR
jgi:hypothetical protein